MSNSRKLFLQLLNKCLQFVEDCHITIFCTVSTAVTESKGVFCLNGSDVSKSDEMTNSESASMSEFID